MAEFFLPGSDWPMGNTEFMLRGGVEDFGPDVFELDRQAQAREIEISHTLALRILPSLTCAICAADAGQACEATDEQLAEMNKTALCRHHWNRWRFRHRGMTAAEYIALEGSFK